MFTHTTQLLWQRQGAAFTDKRYSRRHTLSFDGGITVPGSSSPHVVPVPYSDPRAVDPEEAFISSVSACHMLWFLDFAARHGWVVESYLDQASGALEADTGHAPSFKTITLEPVVTVIQNDQLTTLLNDDEHERLHHLAHDSCFIAQSIKAQVVCKPKLIVQLPQH